MAQLGNRISEKMTSAVREHGRAMGEVPNKAYWKLLKAVPAYGKGLAGALWEFYSMMK